MGILTALIAQLNINLTPGVMTFKKTKHKNLFAELRYTVEKKTTKTTAATKELKKC